MKLLWSEVAWEIIYIGRKLIRTRSIGSIRNHRIFDETRSKA